MSFTSEVKEEICSLKLEDADKISELSGIIGSSFDGTNIKMVTESNVVARRTYTLIRDLFSVYPKITVRKGYNYNKKYLYIVEVLENKEKILKSLGISGFVPAEFIWADEGLARSYLRGVFLTSASINPFILNSCFILFSISSLVNFLFVEIVLSNNEKYNTPAGIKSSTLQVSFK